MEAKCSLLCPQEPFTGPYFEPDASNPHLPPYSIKIHSAIILISTT